jgi:hypothetical protein
MSAKAPRALPVVLHFFKPESLGFLDPALLFTTTIAPKSTISLRKFSGMVHRSLIFDLAIILQSCSVPGFNSRGPFREGIAGDFSSTCSRRRTSIILLLPS